MTDQIKISEVSDILRKELEGINTSIQLEEVGTVLQVSDGVVRIYGLDNAEANELLRFDNGMEAIVKSGAIALPIAADLVHRAHDHKDHHDQDDGGVEGKMREIAV